MDYNKSVHLHFFVFKLIDGHTVMQAESKKNHVLLYLENVSPDHCLFDFHKGCKQHVTDASTEKLHSIKCIYYVSFPVSFTL